MKTPEQLKGTIRSMATKKNLRAQEVLQMFLFERILDRLANSDYQKNFILKGGLLISSMIGIGERTTMDMDTTVRGIQMEEDDIVRIIKEILTVDVGDGIRFEYESIEPIREEDAYNNFRVHLRAKYGKIDAPMKIDVTTGDMITPAAVQYDFPMLFEDKTVPVMAYTLETVLAEKYETIIRRNIGTTRARDFYDLHTLYRSRKSEIRVDVLKTAVLHTAQKRESLEDIKDWKDMLNEKGYPSPGRLRYERGIITNNNKKGSELPWNRHVLKDLLVNVVYIGNLAQGRSSQCLYKGEKYHWTKEADWDVVEGTHEPIISMELWNKVQEINTKASSDVKKSFGRYAHLPKRPNPYGSVLRCADCGRVMKYVRSYSRPKKDGVVTDYYNYKCPTNIELGDTACSKKSIRADDLDKIVLSVIRKQMDLFLDTQKTLLGLIALEKEKAKHSVPANRVKELQDKLDQKKKLFSRLYIDFKDGILTQQEYLLARDVYQKEIAAYESELQELQAIKTKTKVTETGARKWNRLISRYYKTKTVTEEMVEAMVDEIRVNTDGSLDIRFKYMPEFEEMFKECERIRKEVA